VPAYGINHLAGRDRPAPGPRAHVTNAGRRGRLPLGERQAESGPDRAVPFRGTKKRSQSTRPKLSSRVA